MNWLGKFTLVPCRHTCMDQWEICRGGTAHAKFHNALPLWSKKLSRPMSNLNTWQFVLHPLQLVLRRGRVQYTIIHARLHNHCCKFIVEVAQKLVVQIVQAVSVQYCVLDTRCTHTHTHTHTHTEREIERQTCWSNCCGAGLLLRWVINLSNWQHDVCVCNVTSEWSLTPHYLLLILH